MDKNELADILNEPIPFQAPNETNQAEQLVELNNEEEEVVFDQDHDEDSGEEDVDLEADEEAEEDTPNIRRGRRVRFPNPRYQHLQASKERTEEYSNNNSVIIAS